VTIRAEIGGFLPASHSFVFDQQPQQVDFTLPVGGVTESIAVSEVESGHFDRSKSRDAPPPPAKPSQNVINLQRRAAGVLPVRVDVPRAGTSHQFVKPLVVDQEATVMFRYKRR